MPPVDPLRLFVPMVLALAAAWLLDFLCARKGLLPPGFREPWRRFFAFAAVAGLFWVGVFASLGNIGLSQELDITRLRTPELFVLHALMALVLAVWFLLGFAGVVSLPPRPAAAAPVPPVRPPDLPDAVPPGLLPVQRDPLAPDATVAPPELEAPGTPGLEQPPRVSLGRRFAEQFGFVAPNVPQEIGLGLVLGLAIWLAVLVAIIGIGALIVALGGEDAIPKRPPAIVPWIAGLPLAVRLLISLSAGVVEESFFRGFLQPRIGIGLSTAFFVLAHFSYGQPFMLVGITILSLVYAGLVRWRQSVWAAIAAHALFDGIQLTVVIPTALRLLEQQGTGQATAWTGLWPG